MYAIGLVGLGPAGCLFLATLPPEKRGSVIAFDAECIGGDLARLYGGVTANLTCDQMIAALRLVPEWTMADMGFLTAKYSGDVCPLLADVCQQLRQLMGPILSRTRVHTGTVNTCQQGADGTWVLQTSKGPCKVGRLVLCTGAEARKMDLPKSVVPLDVALSEVDLRRFVRPEAHVVVFGTSHSGTLVLRNLSSMGCSHVTAVYRGEQPFRWFRDGDTEGLKQESAAIADAVQTRAWGDRTPMLVSTADFEGVLRATMDADHVIYCIGFISRHPIIQGADGTTLSSPLHHDPTTGALTGVRNAWGFGIGFPGQYTTNTGSLAADVGFGGFVEQIRRCMPAILS